jgi:drug/metabolite transporter (DMT)-like permease
MNERIKGSAMVLLSSLALGSYGLWAKLLGDQFGVFFQAWVRCLLVLLITVPILFLTRQYKPIQKEDRKWIFVTVLFGVFTQVPIYYAFFATFLLMSYTVGRLFFGEKLTRIKVISFLIAVVGLLLTFGLSLHRFTWLALGAAVLNGAASGGEVSTSKRSTAKYSSLQVVSYVWLGTVITHLPLSLLFGEAQIMPSLNAHWAAMMGFVIAGIAGFWLVVEGFRYVEASIGGLLGLTEVVFGILFGILIFHEHFTPTVALGAVLILTAAMLPDLKEYLGTRKRAAQDSF